MYCRRAWQLLPLGVVYALLSCPSISAQLPQKLQRCLPYPTLADEIREMSAETQRQVIVDAVTFQGSPHLSPSILQQLIKTLKESEFDADSDWIERFQYMVRSAWQEQGYFKAEVKAEPQVVSKDSTRARVSMSVHVEEGSQYKLGIIRFTEATDAVRTLVFPPDQLRKLIPLREGEIFNLRKIRDGLEALRKIYSSKGYIDFTVRPIADVSDDLLPRISLVLELDEQKQYRVGSIEILGLDERKENLLSWKLRPGDSFNATLLDDFFKDNKSLLPADTSPEDVQLHRNPQSGTVNLVFDFRTFPCSKRDN